MSLDSIMRQHYQKDVISRRSLWVIMVQFARPKAKSFIYHNKNALFFLAWPHSPFNTIYAEQVFLFHFHRDVASSPTDPLCSHLSACSTIDLRFCPAPLAYGRGRGFSRVGFYGRIDNRFKSSLRAQHAAPTVPRAFFLRSICDSQ